MSVVRFDDYVENIAGTFHQDEEMVLAHLEEIIRSSVDGEGKGRALRDAHAKAYGIVYGRLTIEDGLPPEYAQGIYREPGVHDVVIRYSNGLGHLRPDRYLGAACGMAVKIFDVPGKSLLDDEPDSGTMDYTFINNPTFFCNTARDYVTIQRLFDELPDALVDPARRRSFFYDFLTRSGRAPREEWLWDELVALLSFIGTARQNLLTYTYWSMGSFRHGDHIARLRVVPTAESVAATTHATVDADEELEPFRRTLVDELAVRDHSFDLQVQLCADLVTNPVENTSVSWPERISPPLTVARIDIPAQDIADPTNLECADRVSISPWRTRVEHMPLGEINQLRREVYRKSSVLRHRINAQKRDEPRSAREVFADY